MTIIATKELLVAIGACYMTDGVTGGSQLSSAWWDASGLIGKDESEVIPALQAMGFGFDIDWWETQKNSLAGMLAIESVQPGFCTFGGYRVRNPATGEDTNCDTLEQAQAAKTANEQLWRSNAFAPLVVNHAEYDANGDATWSVVDLFNTDKTENFQVFNPLTGQYIYELTLDAAKQELALVQQQYINATPGLFAIEQSVTNANGVTAWRTVG